jgi:adenylosuccinate lyase
MEERYVTGEFKNFWSLQNKYRSWLMVEFEAYMSHVEYGSISNPDHIFIRDHLYKLVYDMDVQEILAIEKETKHDVVAFLKWLEIKTEGKTRYFHYGMTSSDLVDTALACELVRALSIIDTKVAELAQALFVKANEHCETVMMGRTHGMWAQPTTVANFFSGHLSEILRARAALELAKENVRYGKLSGPVGAYLNISPEVEEYALKRLKLKVEPAATQVIPRDRHLEVILAIARCATAIERLATNIRHLHREEVGEIREGFAKRQKGSSSMPYKRNPIACENLCGMARYLRGFVTPAFENVSLWNERDISHSSVERLMIPEATSYLAYMLDGAINLVMSLRVNDFISKERVDKTNVWASERLMMDLIDMGSTRHAAHDLVDNAISSGDNPLMLVPEPRRNYQDYSRVLDYSRRILTRVMKALSFEPAPYIKTKE